MKKTIEDIQQVLKTAGYYQGAIDGDFGRLSRDALEAAKTAVKNPVSTKQAKKIIEAIQRKLKSDGYYGGHIDGDFGRMSHAALEAAKSAAKNPVSLSQTKSQFKLSQISLDRLKGVNERLVMVVHRALELSGIEFMVVEGLRTKQRQQQLYAQGRTTKGEIVTWILNSKHIDGLAVDLAPVVNGKIDWNDSKKFDEIAKAMFMAAAETKVLLRWGADWNRNGVPREKKETDSPHFELV